MTIPKIKFSFDDVFCANAVILLIFISLAGFFILTGYGPIHDAISWHGVFHYFYNCIEKGIIPFWNPYSQTGTPFYVYYQPFGLLEPSNFLFILIQKITGCTTFTTYIMSYLFSFYLFILGAYYMMREIIKSNKICLLFSSVLFCGCFPMFMRQNGALYSFFLLPFILFFLLLFFKEPNKRRKSLYCFIVAYLLALSFNINIPSGIMFAVLLFLLFSFLFKSGLFRETIDFIRTRQGTASMMLSLLLIVLISLPVIALYYDFHINNEEFPSVRILQKNGNNIVKVFVTDIDQNLFSEKFTNNLKVSNNLWNMIGIIYEPVLHFISEDKLSSENFMYISILPILCGIVAFKRKDRHVFIFGLMALLTLLLMENWKKQVVAKPGIFQGIITFIIPFLRPLEVLQNFAPLFLLCAVVLGAIGFENIKEDKRVKLILNASNAVILFKLLILVVSISLFLNNMSFGLIWNNIYGVGNTLKLAIKSLFPTSDINISHTHILMFIRQTHIITFILITTSIAVFIMNKFTNNISKDKLLKISLLLLFLDLAVFVTFHATHFGIDDIISYERVINNKYYSVLKHDAVLKSKQEGEFINYREPFSDSTIFSKYPDLFRTFWGHEVYSATKTAFPAVVGLRLFKEKAFYWDDFYMTKYYYDCLRNVDLEKQLMTSSIISPILNYYPAVVGLRLFKDKGLYWDHFYMTKYYYDYLSNIDLEKQLMTSGIVSPILNYYPSPDVIFAKDKYEVVRKINEASLEYLGKHIFIEKNEIARFTSSEVLSFFESKYFLRPDDAEMAKFRENLDHKTPQNSGMTYAIRKYDVNGLTLSVEVLKDGYFYFGDGYSKYWNAFIDGTKTKIYKTNINFKSVYVPKGNHTIEMLYDPVFFRYSLYGYLMGNIMALCCIAVLYYQCRNGNHSQQYRQ